jgi:LPXTG-site transpeptidase (sortase) family protein
MPPSLPVSEAHSGTGGLMQIGTPTELLIQSLHIQAPIVGVGVLRDGRMETPNNAFEVGWFKNGPKPGKRGNAVLAGHLDTVLGTPGVFWSLDTIKEGTDIQIRDAYGQLLHFKVQKTQTYKTSESPVEEIFTKGFAPRLILITCDGAWNEHLKDYERRLVVEADLVTDSTVSSMPSTL